MYLIPILMLVAMRLACVWIMNVSMLAQQCRTDPCRPSEQM